MVLIYLIQFEIFCIIDVETWMSLWISRMEHFIQISGLDSWKTCGPVAQNYCQNCMTDIGSPPLFMSWEKGDSPHYVFKCHFLLPHFMSQKWHLNHLRCWETEHRSITIFQCHPGDPGSQGSQAHPLVLQKRNALWCGRPGTRFWPPRSSKKSSKNWRVWAFSLHKLKKLLTSEFCLQTIANPTNIGSLWHCIFDTETNGGCAYRRSWAADLRVVIEDTKDHSNWR